MKGNKIFYLFLRYSIIILAGMGNLFLFYKIFTPFTMGLSSAALSIFSGTAVIHTTIFFKNMALELIPACIAGSAYFLLFILVLSTPELNLKKRILVLGFCFLSLLVLNTFRITFLALIADSVFFDQIHIIFWYIISTAFVLLIWILAVRIFKISEIPFYSDILYLIKTSEKAKKANRGK